MFKEEELKLFEIGVKSLNTFVTTKKEKEKQQNLSFMPKTGQISVNDFLQFFLVFFKNFIQSIFI